ncbi:MFS transporter [Rickettsia bellii]|uniref:Sugar (And other) transporter family protein n=2 Tax=Rickettsia bellii TaxID=33990 RepID=A0A0F3QKB3_RICBE|nr:MFS transporter [Rickettsia bellii]ARD86056.1 MFS transporter [Rickettsia bellii]KJV90466.1 sugar (and other) transporter family protein [Rickettsia bellii str. RML An4]KJV92662.1 sugar (and other) transporter family protein [Rickettsia bellii str. RML Mogi]
MKQKKSANKVLGAFLGTIIEYYDYSLYGFSAAIIAEKFFSPATDQLTKLVNVFAVYAVAYLSKPLGAYIFGRIGDKYGRKKALSFTIIGIIIPTLIIGLLPDYSTLGVWSTIILVLCRFMQGIFIAGEYDGAAIYVIEHLGPKYQFTASAITRCTGVIGLLSGIGVTNFFNAHIFPDWSWRIPFLLSVPLGLVTLYYRQKFDETPEFKKAGSNNSIQKFNVLIRKQWKNILPLIFLAGGFGATYQIAIIFMKQYLPLVLPATGVIMSSFSVLVVLCFAVFMPIAGFIADRIRVNIVLKTALISTIIASIIFTIAVEYQMTNLGLFASLMLAASVAPFNALAHSVVIKSFAVRERYRVISFGHTIGSMLMSGTANYICLLVIKKYNFTLFPILYICIFSVLAYSMTLLYDRDNQVSNN